MRIFTCVCSATQGPPLLRAYSVLAESFGEAEAKVAAHLDSPLNFKIEEIREVCGTFINLPHNESMRKMAERLAWLHTGGGERDPEGYEWGVFRVKWDRNGQPESVLHTLSDFSDLDREMAREAAAKEQSR